MKPKGEAGFGRTVWDFISLSVRDRRVLFIAAGLLVLTIALVLSGVLHLSYVGGTLGVDTQPLRNTEIRSDRTLVRVKDRRAACDVKDVVVPTFSSSLVNTGGPTDGDYCDALADVFSIAFARLFGTTYAHIEGEPREFRTRSTLDQLRAQQVPGNVLLGYVHAYQDERPDIGQRAAFSVTLRLVNLDGKVLWQAARTMTASSRAPAMTGDKRLSGLQVVEIAARFADELADRVALETACPLQKAR